MKIRDIIRDSQWLPPRNLTADVLPITVMLPNYNRGRTGLFEAAIKSILAQTFTNFNLIVIEDGSDDNSMDIVRKYMELDPRVGCVYHPRNIGIPAISVYEAYVLTKSEYICLCFNDNDFYPSALSNLYDAAQAEPNAVVYGHVEFQQTGSRPGALIQHHRFGSVPTPQAMLVSHNFIPNPAVILSRKIIEKVGFFDPHVGITRLNDWDYWRRCAEYCEVKPVDVSVCLEKGPRLKDSLGSVHHMSLWLCEEWMRRPRNEILRVESLEDYDIMEIPEDLSETNQTILKEIGASFKSKFWWHDVSTPEKKAFPGHAVDLPKDGQILVVTADQGPSRSLYFDYLSSDVSQRMRVINYGSWQGRPEEMVGAAAVIFTRSLKGYADWIEFAKRMRVPHYWFTDDNHFALSATEPSAADYGEEFVASDHRNILKSFSGVLASTEPLCAWLKENKMHDNVFYYPPILPQAKCFPDPAILRPLIFPRGIANSVRICVFGGKHRLGSFEDVVLPAINALAETRGVELYIVSSDPLTSAVSENVDVHYLPVEISYGLALARLRALNPDILIHPPTVPTGNLPFKTLNCLINAGMLNAVPVVADQPPFTAIKGLGVAVVCEGTEQGWEKGLEEAIGLHESQEFLPRLHSFLLQNFSGENNRNVISTILKDSTPPGFLIREQRFNAVKDLFLERTKATLMPTQGAEINALIENQRRIKNSESEFTFERHMFLKSISGWPPNVDPISPDEISEAFMVKNCFGVADDRVLKVATAVQMTMENVVTAVTTANDYLTSLGIWNDYWSLAFGPDLRELGYKEIGLSSPGDLLALILCLRIHPGISGELSGAIYDRNGDEVAMFRRELNTFTGLVPVLVTLDKPIHIHEGESYMLRLFVENATDSVQFAEFVEKNPRKKGPGERRTYFSAVYDAASSAS